MKKCLLSFVCLLLLASNLNAAVKKSGYDFGKNFEKKWFSFERLYSSLKPSIRRKLTNDARENLARSYSYQYISKLGEKGKKGSEAYSVLMKQTSLPEEALEQLYGMVRNGELPLHQQERAKWILSKFDTQICSASLEKNSPIKRSKTLVAFNEFMRTNRVLSNDIGNSSQSAPGHYIDGEVRSRAKESSGPHYQDSHEAHALDY